ETGQMLVDHLDASLQALKTDIAETAGRILKPFVQALVHRLAIDELHVSLDALVSMDNGVSLHISGPGDILEALQVRLSERALAVTYPPTDGPDVKITAGQATLETCLKSWMEKLEEAVR